MSKKLYTSLLAAGMMAASVNAFAATASGTLTVNASVSSTCSVSPATLSFTYVSGQSSAATASAALNFVCTSGTAYSVALNGGGNLSNSADFTTSNMSDGSGNLLNYALYQDSGNSQLWGDATGNSAAQPNFSGTGASQSATVYGVVPASQSVPEGSYSDAVTVTATFS